MTKQMQQQLVELTQECLTRYWQLDTEFALSYCAEDVLWVGAVQSQFMEGLEATAEDLRSTMKELKPCHLLQQDFYVVQNNGNVCTIAGRYLVTTDETVEYYLQVQQRCTFVWELVKGNPKIKHMHISNPMGELKLAKGEKFANTLGKMAQKYWLKEMNASIEKKHIVVTDLMNVTHFLLPVEIVYAAADKNNCSIHTTTGEDIYVRMKITEFLSAAGAGFAAVHRSYVINSIHVSSIRPHEIKMTDNTIIPVPIKKYKEVRDWLVGGGGLIKNLKMLFFVRSTVHFVPKDLY